jgi:hypothetical protein
MGKLDDEVKKANPVKRRELNSDTTKSTVMNTTVDDIARTFARYKYMMLDVDATNDFIEVGPNDQVELSELYPIFMNGIVSKSILYYLKRNGFEILYERNFRWGEREIPMEYGEMITSRGVTENLIIKGMQFAVKTVGDVKLVINTNFTGMTGIVTLSFQKQYMEMFGNALKEIARYIDELDYMRGEKISASGQLLNVSEYLWDDVVLEDGIQRSLEDNILNFFDKKELYLINGIPFKMGVILEGPPGTGKTLIGKILANKTKDATFMLSTAKDICDSGDVANLFRMARRLAPTIIFMEDIDFFGQSRTAGKVMRVTGELLNQMDGIEDNNGILTVATTNHPEMIDDAIMRRPGRFDVRVEVGALCASNREKLLTRFLDGRQKTEDVNFTEIAAICNEFNGSHIRALANNVCIRAINDGSLDENGHIILLKEHFVDAIARIKKHIGIEENLNGDDEYDEPYNDMAEKTGYAKEKKEEYVEGFNGFLFKKSDVEEIIRKRL